MDSRTYLSMDNNTPIFSTVEKSNTPETVIIAPKSALKQKEVRFTREFDSPPKQRAKSVHIDKYEKEKEYSPPTKKLNNYQKLYKDFTPSPDVKNKNVDKKQEVKDKDVPTSSFLPMRQKYLDKQNSIQKKTRDRS